jgi:hypothetical protein
MTHLGITRPAPAPVKLRAAALALMAAFMVALASPDAQAASRNTKTFTVVPITVDGVIFDSATNQLVALVSLSGKGQIRVPITISGTCPVLNLQLGPIDLNILGLEVKTSSICLNITAQPGSGNLLGNLLCSLTNALNSGVPLSTFLASLSASDLTSLLSGLQNLLNGALGALTSTSSITSVQQVSANCSQQILSLSIGPLNLNLLGLVVTLNNCANGPVTVTISTTNGLLASLICDLQNLLGSGGSLTAVIAKLQDLANEISAIIAAA